MIIRCIGVCAEDHFIKLVKEGISLLNKTYNNTMVTAEYYSLREHLLYRIREKNFDVVVVAYDGAMGMEIAIGVRDFLENVPLIWISDQQGFLPQSYRLHTTSFMFTEPTPEQISNALTDCLSISLQSAVS